MPHLQQKHETLPILTVRMHHDRLLLLQMQSYQVQSQTQCQGMCQQQHQTDYHCLLQLHSTPASHLHSLLLLPVLPAADAAQQQQQQGQQPPLQPPLLLLLCQVPSSWLWLLQMSYPCGC
jgi:hypothetical protein